MFDEKIFKLDFNNLWKLNRAQSYANIYTALVLENSWNISTQQSNIHLIEGGGYGEGGWIFLKKIKEWEGSIFEESKRMGRTKNESGGGYVWS